MADFTACPSSPSACSASGGGEFEEGEVVRLHKLKLLNMRYEGSLVAVREYLPKKGLWRVVLNTGEGVEVPSGCMVKVDPEEYGMGELVRLKGLPILQALYEKSIVAVQEYCPLKDMWKVCLNNGDKMEVYPGVMKKLDDAATFSTGDLVRMTSSDHTTGEIVTVREYLSMKDAWKVTRSTGTDTEAYSENLLHVDPHVFAEGDLLIVEGVTVAVQEYLPSKDSWKVRASDGSAFEIFSEQVLRMDTPGSAFEGLAQGGQGPATITDTFKNLFKKPEKKSKWLSNPFKKTKPVEGRGGYTVGDQVHLVNSGGKIALCKEWSEGKGKWKCIMNTGQLVEARASEMKPPIEPFGFQEGQLVKLNSDGAIAAVQEVVAAKGQLKLRLPSGKAVLLYPDEFTLFKDGEAAVNEEPSVIPVIQQPPTTGLMDELVSKLAEAGCTLEEVRGFSEADIDELLKDELKIPVVKRNKMKMLIKKNEVEIVEERTVEPVPEPEPEPEPKPTEVEEKEDETFNFL